MLDAKKRSQLVILLLEGVDDYWWTIPENFQLINDLREWVGMDTLTENLRSLVASNFEDKNNE